MKTLADYIKGYPGVAVLLLDRYVDKNNNKYYLCKVDGSNNFYYMKGEEVIDVRYIVADHYQKLSIDYENHKNDADILKSINEQPSYRYFVKFIKEQTGENYSKGDC